MTEMQHNGWTFLILGILGLLFSVVFIAAIEIPSRIVDKLNVKPWLAPFLCMCILILPFLFIGSLMVLFG